MSQTEADDGPREEEKTMPLIEVHLLEGRTDEQKEKLLGAITAAVHESIGAPLKEMLDSANLSWGNFPLLSHGASEALRQHGEEWQRQAFLKPIVEGRWTGTMCLTESQCGTDLAQVKTRAVPNPDGTHSINGTKIFVSAGEHDLVDNIIHIVLARLPGAPEGSPPAFYRHGFEITVSGSSPPYGKRPAASS